MVQSAQVIHALRTFLNISFTQKGVHESLTAGADQHIIDYLETTHYPNPTTDKIPWCSAFVNWVVTQAGFKGTDSAAASSWLTWGSEIKDPLPGSIAVLPHHVAFYLSGIKDSESKRCRIVLRGGNQGNMVCDKNFLASEVISYRIPFFN